MSNITQKTIIGSGHLNDAIYSTHQKFTGSMVPLVGDRAVHSDGSEFVYCSTAVDLLAGQVVAYATAQATPLDDKCTAAAIGDTQVTIDTKAVAFFGGSAGVVAAGRFAGGYLVTNDDAGEGYRYRILDNTAGTASASVTFTLQDPLKIALTAASDVILVGPRYERVVEGTASLAPLGIVQAPTLAATNSRIEYVWVQVKGVAAVKVTTGTSVAVGVNLVADASGGVKIASAATDLLVGIALATDTTATGKIPVQLNIGG